MPTIPEALAAAFAHHQRGELPAAEHIYRQIVAADPNLADAWHLLGVVAHQSGRPAEAVQSIARAVKLNATNPAYFNHLGAAYAAQGDLDRAEAAFRSAMKLDQSSAETHYNLAALLVLRGRAEEAENAYRRAVALLPSFAEAHFNLGNLLREAGRHAEAAASYSAALAARPRYFKAVMSLANAQLRLDRWEEAEASYRLAIDIDPQHAEAHYWLGSLLQSRERLDEAAQILRTAVFLNPRHFEAQNNLGCVYRALGELDQAEQCFNLALAVRPDSAEALSNLGSALHDRKQYDAAAAMMRRALEINPDFVQAHNNLGAVLQDQKRFDEALEQYRAALALDEKSVESLINVGAVQQMQGHPEQSLDFQRRALAIDPNNSRAHYSMAAALHALHRTDEAIENYAEAIRLKPDYAEAYYNRSFVWLSRGDFARGWPDYEWRFRCKDYVGRRFDAPRWDGSPLAGRTLLVHAEQGLGDTMHFIRYVKLLEGSGGSVIVEVQPALLPLLKASGLTKVIGGGTPLPRFDVHASLLSLPGLLGTNLENIPAKVPYLATDPRQAKEWRGRLRAMPGFKVGIVWQGNLAYAFDHLRSIPLVEFAPLAKVSGVQLLSLQKGPGQEQLAACADRFTAIDLGSTLDSQGGAFVETAAVMCNLDLVVTSDTAGAHLAGALGVPTWLALAHAPEWRWLVDRDDSPWYPTMRLFRQPQPGEWAAVFDRMAAELEHLVRERSPNR